MRQAFILFILLSINLAVSQNVTTDWTSYTPQQLIEDVLIGNACISNVQVTNVVGGNFNTNDLSYGYFNANGSSFPFQEGVVLSTGKLSNVDGPNTSLSDDNANNWQGDTDLEQILNESNTINATIIEFEFTAPANQISFRYLFASEEYQEGNPNTCQYSDLFGFLIRQSGTQQYENIALVPETNTPVKVTTVHPGIPGACQEENQAYFGSWNNSNAPINFNGQTAVLTAIANTTPNVTYEVKLVIADEQNFRYDSAVFLEASSFELYTDLGPNLLQDTNNALCENDTTTLDASQPNATTYTWFKDNVLQPEITSDFLVDSPGTYSVEVTLNNGCISYGEVVIEEFQQPIVQNTSLTNCDIDQDGYTTFNLNYAEQTIINNDSNLFVVDYFTDFNDAQQQINPIQTPDSFNNTQINQTVFALVSSTQSNCFNIAEVNLSISNNTLSSFSLDACDEGELDGFTTFDLTQVQSQIANAVPANSTITFYQNLDNAFAETNPSPLSFENTEVNFQTIYAKVTSNGNECFAVTNVDLSVLYTPQIEADQSLDYCLNSYPETITLYGGVLNDSPSNYYYQWLLNGVDTGVNTSFIDINEIGTYTVIITDPNGCSNSRNIIVNPIEAPIIESIDYTDFSNNNTVTINLENTGQFSYAIDGQAYQNSNTFTNVSAGLHTVYVTEINGCQTVEQTIAIIGFPKYFTPNNDTIHDFWKPYGMTDGYNTNLDVKIFDRYGKLIHIINPNTKGWDGTYRGRLMPANDYWFLLTDTNGRTYRNHFALKR
jgi:gliding motility-associated-like protein